MFGVQTAAFASIIDNDPNCRQYGCVVVAYDNQNFIIYDNIRPDGTLVQLGEPMVPRFSTPGYLNDTDTLNQAIIPTANQGMMLGIAEDGTQISRSVFDTGNQVGFLDAGDDLAGGFSLSSTTAVVLDGMGQEYSQSFFITSYRTRMSLRARVANADFTDHFSSTLGLSDITLTPSITNRGSDGGFNYGTRANAGNIQINNLVSNLGDLSGTPKTLMNFNRRQGILKRNGDLDEQSIRLDFLYTMPKYDFSMGVGSMNVQLEFEIYNEGTGNNNGNNGNNNGPNPPGPNPNANPNATR
jgi:hypothetical protein